MSTLRGHLPPTRPRPDRRPTRRRTPPKRQPNRSWSRRKSQKKKLADPHGQHRRRRCPPATGKIAASNPVDGVDFSANSVQRRNRRPHPF